MKYRSHSSVNPKYFSVQRICTELCGNKITCFCAF